MAFKQSPFPMVKGTKGHGSALKQLKGNIEKHGKYLLDTSTKEGKAISEQIKNVKTVSSNVNPPKTQHAVRGGDLVKKWDKASGKTHAKELSKKALKGLKGLAKKGGKKTLSYVASRSIPVIGEALLAYDVLKEGVKRVATKSPKLQLPEAKATKFSGGKTWSEAKKKTKSIWDKEKSPMKHESRSMGGHKHPHGTFYEKEKEGGILGKETGKWIKKPGGTSKQKSVVVDYDPSKAGDVMKQKRPTKQQMMSRLKKLRKKRSK